MKRAIRWISGGLAMAMAMNSCVAVAQTQEPSEAHKRYEPAPRAPETSQPLPEHKALGYFAGKWTSESEMQPGPYGPGGKLTSHDDCKWFRGGFQMVCRSEAKGPVGSMTSMGIMAYLPAERVYSYYGIDDKGMSELSVGSKEGKTWTFVTTTQMDGQPVKSRYTIVESSPSAYTFRWETSPDGANWSTHMEGKSTKSGT